MLRKFFGTKDFYRRLMVLILPIMLQNGITNFVNMLDNVMVGQVGTIEMTGVAVSNQLIFVFNLCIFGAISGAGIFGAQFYGKGDHRGLKHTLRFKMIFCSLLTLLCIALFIFFGEKLIGLYLKGEGSAENAALSLSFAKDYLNIILIGLLPYTIAQCYSSTLRETGKTLLPMLAGVTAVLINLVLNYILIFGHFGAPKLGVNGAAIATVISRFVELFIVAIWTHMHSKENPFIIGIYKSARVPLTLCKDIFIKGLPLLVNEALWASGVATVNQCYSIRGLNVVAAFNISQTFYNVFSVAFLSVGMAIGIVLGQQLGSGKTSQAKITARHLIVFSIIISLAVGVVYAFISGIIPRAYNTTGEVRSLAADLMKISALTMPLEAVANATYFTLRSGGKTLITFLFDSCFVWSVSVVAAFILSSFTSLPILTIYFICQFLNIIKCIIGIILVEKGNWVRNIVTD